MPHPAVAREHAPLDRITTALVHDLAASMRRGGLAPSSVNGALRTLKVLLHQAVERGEIERYPLTRRVIMEPVDRSHSSSPMQSASTSSPPSTTRRVSAPTSAGHVTGETSLRASVSAACRAALGGSVRPEGHAAEELYRRFRDLKPLFAIALETGLRQGDLLRLRWSAVDASAGMLRVSVAKTRRVAVIPLSTACREAFAELRSRNVLSEAVFVDEVGKPIGLGRVLQVVRTAKAMAGIRRRFRFHDLRHTFACRLASSGVPIQLIARALAHTSIRTCERYARPSEEALRVVRDALDRDAVGLPGVQRPGAKSSSRGE